MKRDCCFHDFVLTTYIWCVATVAIEVGVVHAGTGPMLFKPRHDIPTGSPLLKKWVKEIWKYSGRFFPIVKLTFFHYTIFNHILFKSRSMIATFIFLSFRLKARLIVQKRLLRRILVIGYGFKCQTSAKELWYLKSILVH